MLRHAIQRLIQGILVLGFASFAIYMLLGLMPGDPVDLMASGNPEVTPEDLRRLRELHGVDRPILERYAAWAGAVLTGDLGYSRSFNRPVLATIGPYFLNTLVLMSAAFVVALGLGVALGLLAAADRGGRVDAAINAFAFVSASVPTFWLGLLAIVLFAVVLGWLPASALPPPGADGFWERARHLILPVATLALVEAGEYARHMRAAAIDALGQDWIRTARAKGASPARVLRAHVLRNALIPVATVAALGFGGLFSGALVTETIFAYPGMGKLIYDAILTSDFNLALACLLMAAALVIAANFAADLVYAALDPRVGFGRAPGDEP
ncbi:MAG: ABC transporter permease [Tagaea sp.]|nr:ABC transporter permease [Azospirillum sp.]MCZ8125146.1 ABC transporter permease [Magnetospirillum sp.]